MKKKKEGILTFFKSHTQWIFCLFVSVTSNQKHSYMTKQGEYDLLGAQPWRPFAWA